MPRLDGNMESHTIGRGGFAFTGARMDRLEATNYTLVTLGTDATGSVVSFVSELETMERKAIEACRKSAHSDNILVRLLRFSSAFPKGVDEVFGFTPLADIDVNTIPPIRAGGMTPLCDAAYSAIGATNEYARKLKDNDFGVNGIEFLLTDGGENASVATMKMVKEEQAASIQSEALESNISILVGINSQTCRAELEEFQREAGINQYVDVGDATPQRLAKLAEFVSRSVSSQSQALGTGGPSQQISATI